MIPGLAVAPVLQDTAKNTQHLEHRKSQARNVKKQKAVRSLRTPCATKQKPDSLTMFNPGSKLSTGSKFREKAGINSQMHIDGIFSPMNVNKHQQHQPPNVSNQKPPGPSDAALAAEELWLGTWRASGSILPKQIPCQGRPLAIRLRKHQRHKRYICHRPCNTKLEVFN